MEAAPESCESFLSRTVRRFEQNASFLLCLILFFLVITAFAWVDEDAFITFRTVDNFVNGYGLRWNIDQRVETYTHPLWMMIHIPFFYLSENAFLVSVFICISFSLCAFIAAARAVNPKPSAFLLFSTFTLPLMLSKALREYFTSGLETPLTIFFLALFINRLLKKSGIFTLSIIAGLAALNRLDTILFYAPCLAFLVYKNFNFKSLGKIAGGFIPLILWQIFRLFYYGLVFPNTKYAKLSPTMDAAAAKIQGLLYVFDLFRFDVISAVLLVCGLALLIHETITGWKTRFPDYEINSFLQVGAGAVLYLIYTVNIAGDYMRGRFLSPVIFFSVLFIYYRLNRILQKGYMPAMAVIIPLCFPGLFFFNMVRHHNLADYSLANTGISDQFSSYAYTNTLVSYFLDKGPARHMFAERAAQFRKFLDDEGTDTVATGAVGMAGYYAGPNIRIIDEWALGDVLLSHLPLMHPEWWVRPGHYKRLRPVGYLSARQTGNNGYMEKNIGQYYGIISNIVSGPLFDIGRIKNIIDFNLGRYDYLLENYLDLKDIGIYPMEYILQTHIENRWGIEIPYAKEAGFASKGYISANAVLFDGFGYNRFRLSFYNNGRYLGAVDIPEAEKIETERSSWGKRLVYFPREVANIPFNMVKIKSVEDMGDGKYQVGLLVFGTSRIGVNG